jgi:hypothetical protein
MALLDVAIVTANRQNSLMLCRVAGVVLRLQ